MGDMGDNNCERLGYTDLRWTYFIKMLVFIAISAVTIIMSEDFEALLLNSLIFLVGICFDFFVSGHSKVLSGMSGPFIERISNIPKND